MASFIYLASPYSHPSSRVRCERYWAALQKAADIMAETGRSVFCPIAHSHPIAEHLPDELRHSFEFWMNEDLPILKQAEELWVYTMPGWQESKGVTREIETAIANNIPIRHIA